MIRPGWIYGIGGTEVQKADTTLQWSFDAGLPLGWQKELPSFINACFQKYTVSSYWNHHKTEQLKWKENPFTFMRNWPKSLSFKKQNSKNKSVMDWLGTKIIWKKVYPLALQNYIATICNTLPPLSISSLSLLIPKSKSNTHILNCYETLIFINFTY